MKKKIIFGVVAGLGALGGLSLLGKKVIGFKRRTAIYSSTI